MRSATLVGRDHHVIGALAAVAEGPAAITLSRGGAKKTYSHTEPNEDAALFAFGKGGVLVAVADGHHGATGSQSVVGHLEWEWAEPWTAATSPFADGPPWEDQAMAALVGANHALLAEAAERGLPPAPTTLSIALTRPAEGLLCWAGVGDSHVFTVTESEATDVLKAGLGDKRSRFLGYEAQTEEKIAPHAAAGTRPLDGLVGVALASDGLSETGIGVADPAAAVLAAARAAAEAPADLRPLELAKGVSRLAMDAHLAQTAGDNMSSAAIWIAAP